VPLDTTNYTEFHSQLLSTGALREFALNYTSQNRAALEKYNSPNEFSSKFKFKDSDYKELIAFAATRDVTATDTEQARAEVLNNLKALVARSKWNGDGFYPVINENDKAIQAALNSFN
jgi:carboxyl-terminal processing protease